ncbi:succinylglutamate desuccinylase/aspartoacylase family protein [Fusobacterium nucleatum]|uniref:Succinylglutamate desuccinylase n=3 Tax=Fusobacterium nucleatum subsp. nucleatum TaxID=76856 RepID=A0ABN5J4Y3_FUSNN|nr:succinylglutamate desuccinylase/aspartoacylase family protein [Fusobacterium nucleatum]ALF25400.1 succinylglutamate desuccinylase [Fusobacterium nucleatum subsp. nucleatum]AVQ15302.1 succinylglutamate desuccinylase [Fusobacterium nucleatum subsp. nucleatum ATCC 25586]KUL98726.1 succinylglutamate desuccinylase [Fusobacterium nucleatum subsp. nucleatum]MCG6841895.1 succinylglutamate desuccinylase/aspartoacylase family protein [Fusobacterium nucleatum]WMS30220.1 succinylglutamate desuccinylase
MKGNKITGIIMIFLSLVITFIAGKEFLKTRELEPIVKSDGVTSMQKLSDYLPALKGTRGDSDIYILQGKEPGGSVLILGGTHPNEPAAFLTTVLLVENLKVDKGTVYIIPRANGSAMSHNDPQEASPQRFTIETPYGERWFRFGSRATNPLDQWPDPDVYIHAASGQKLSGNETRNLNRAYPGRADGTYTEKIAYAITELIKKNDINMEIDLHEASPEYPVINAIVAHERAMPISSQVVMNMEFEDIQIGLEPSPPSLHGLTHRELGDYTNTYAVLMETANASQGRLRGKTDENLVLTGKDPTYVKAQKIGRLFVPYDENGHPIEERVGRHLTGVVQHIIVMGENEPDKEIIIEGLPSYEDLQKNGVGTYLKEVKEDK